MSEMAISLRNRGGNQLGSVSPKTQKVLKLYEDHLQVRFGERTAPEYLSLAGTFLVWLEDRGVDLFAVRPSDLVAYQSALYAARKGDGTPYAMGSQANRIKGVRSFFRFLFRRGYLLSDPASSLEMPRQDERLPRVILTKDEVERILETPKTGTAMGLRDRALLELLYATGVRASELCHLAVEDVDTEDRLLRVVRGKGRKDRNVPLTRKASGAIEEYLVEGRRALARGGRTLFLTRNGNPLNRARVNEIVHYYAHEAKISKRVTCHTFRHTLATHLLRGRADIRHIQALLGHSSLQTTERYTRVEISDLRAVIARAHPRGR
jgi:integrase/recombinase XerD